MINDETSTNSDKKEEQKPSPQEEQKKKQEEMNDKNKLNKRIDLEIIEENINTFLQRYSSLENGEIETGWGKPQEPLKVLEIEFNESKVLRNQFPESRIKNLLKSIPNSLIQLSALVSFHYHDKVLIPKFEEGTGKFLGKDEELTLDVFYKECREGIRHPHLILTAVTTYDGKAIHMVPIPETVSENLQAVRIDLDQIFFHEFFHTITSSRSCANINIEDQNEAIEIRRAIELKRGEEKFTFEDWWNEFKEIINNYIRGNKLPIMSNYSSVYIEKVKSEDPKISEPALGELMAEAFTGYMLNVLPRTNENGGLITDFQSTFPEIWELMDKLCQAEVIKTDQNKEN